MREIKFRAWDKEDKSMIYSDETYPNSKYKFEFEVFNDFNITLTEMVDRETVYTEEGEETWLEYFLPVDAEIMQYTGKSDKNLKEIYEGDIVVSYIDDLGIVKYENISGAYIVEDVKTRGIYPLGLLSYRMEVIGNIYENPELLEGREK